MAARSLALSVLLVAGSASAEDEPDDPIAAPARAPTSAPPPHQGNLAPLPGHAGEGKRRFHPYDGRPPRKAPGPALLWIPRVLLSPLYAVTEYGVREPLGALVSAIERGGTVSDPSDAPSRVGFAPTGRIELAYRPRVGIYFFHDDFLARSHSLRVTVTTGGARSLRASVVDRIPLRVDAHQIPVSFLQAELEGSARPDLLYFGAGPSTRRGDEGQYERLEKQGGLRLHAAFGDSSFVESYLGVREARFADGHCEPVRALFTKDEGVHCADASLLEEATLGRYAVPTGFANGYALIDMGARLVLDSRAPRPAPGTGASIELRAGEGSVVSGDRHGSFVSYGATATGYLDITGTRRVLSLAIAAQSLDPLTKGFEVPFGELLGTVRDDYMPEGDLMRGFFPGRLVGNSSLSATLGYQWPIWSFLDATLQAAFGNVFAEHWKDFEPERLRFSFAAGATTFRDVDHQFNLLLGFGTATFEQGGRPDSIRFLLGGTTGF